MVDFCCCCCQHHTPRREHASEWDSKTEDTYHFAESRGHPHEAKIQNDWHVVPPQFVGQVVLLFSANWSLALRTHFHREAIGEVRSAPDHWRVVDQLALWGPDSPQCHHRSKEIHGTRVTRVVGHQPFYNQYCSLNMSVNQTHKPHVLRRPSIAERSLASPNSCAIYLARGLGYWSPAPRRGKRNGRR